MNNSIAKFIADKTLKLMIQKDHKIKDSNVLILGVTFKENCPDCRNTKVVDIASELEDFGCKVDIYDPWASPAVVKHEYGKDLIAAVDPKKRGNRLSVAREEALVSRRGLSWLFVKR